jgi:lipopolysaccharide biosynthesis glycosyltransferase
MDHLHLVAEPVSIVFAANDYYVPYLATLIASILDNADAARPLELFVLERDFTAQHKAELERQVAAARQQA